MSEGGFRNAQNGANLSRRERECILWLSEGYRTKDIAIKLDISPSAVALYLNNARKKLDAQSREHLVAKAIFAGILHPPNDL